MKKIFFKVLVLCMVFVTLSCEKTKTHKDKLQVHYENLDPQELTIKNIMKPCFPSTLRIL